jgi:hypothetical protein
MDGARTALADAAAVFRAHESQRVAEHPQHRGIWRDVYGVGLTVNAESVLAHEFSQVTGDVQLGLAER